MDGGYKMENVAFYRSFIYSSLLHIWTKSSINYQKTKRKKNSGQIIYNIIY